MPAQVKQSPAAWPALLMFLNTQEVLVTRLIGYSHVNSRQAGNQVYT
jgi:hypothetical protein